MFSEKTTKVGFLRRFQKGEITSFNITFHPRHTGCKDTVVTQIRSRIGLSRLEAIPRNGTGATEHHDELKKIHRLMKVSFLADKGPILKTLHVFSKKKKEVSPQNGEDKMFIVRPDKEVDTKQPGFSHETPASCAQHPSLASLGLNQPPLFWLNRTFSKIQTFKPRFQLVFSSLPHFLYH